MIKLTEDVLRDLIVNNLVTEEDIRQILDNNKLRELIEIDCKRLEPLTDFPSQVTRARMMELLEKSKK